jgi:hypothetical protein
MSRPSEPVHLVSTSLPRLNWKPYSQEVGAYTETPARMLAMNLKELNADTAQKFKDPYVKPGYLR